MAARRDRELMIRITGLLAKGEINSTSLIVFLGNSKQHDLYRCSELSCGHDPSSETPIRNTSAGIGRRGSPNGVKRYLRASLELASRGATLI